MNGSDVLHAADACRDLLGGAVELSWDVPVAALGRPVAQVVAHAANGPLWYALDLWGGVGDDAAFDLTVKADVPNAAIISSLSSAAHVCAASVDAAPPDLRGFHPDGSPDASGFAALACDELLVHTNDAAGALGLSFAPDAGLAAAVLARLFPWHERTADPWRALLWANGRIELPGQPSQQGWRWHCAPLAEWDGTPPALR